MYAASQAASRGEDVNSSSYASILGQGPQTPAGSTVMQIEPPSTTDDANFEDDSEDEEDEDRPLNRDELRAKTIKSLAKREATGGARKVVSKGKK
jgi:hypothetical protein|mmetsp:Transcript_38893/g.62318  ORF Transcript_38893/g.62318 Transcript_38893/m.62318 type:complete len:95 (-) Transcript_38893:355-639(-)